MGAVSIGRVFNPSYSHLMGKEAANFPAAAAAVGTDQHTAEEILKSALDAVGGISRFVRPGQVVAIKPNATWAFAPHTASSTDPELLRALIHLVQDAGASRVIVMDHCSIEPGTVQCLKANGLGAVVEETGVEGVFPDRYLAPKDTYTTIELPEGRAFTKIGVIKAAVEADVRINMGVAKSHSVTRMTLALKHMMGFLESPGSLHSNLHKGIADINTSSGVRADLHILEALRIRMAYGDFVSCGGPQTDETHPHMIKRMNQIIAGIDPVLVDAYACSTFYNVKPKEFAHLQNAADWGIGDLKIEAAAQSGKFKTVNVGEVISDALPETELQAVVVESDVVEPVVEEIPAAKPLTEIIAQDSFKEVNAVSNLTGNNAVSPNEFLKTALIPAAAILTGAGLVASRNKDRHKSPEDPDKEDHEE